MELKKNKRIGKVLLIVEGGKHEFSLIKKIFSDILGYKRIEKRRGRAIYFQSPLDGHSVVAIINTRTSNITSIGDRDYLDSIYTELYEQCDFDVNNAAVYYLFDRDPESNTDTESILYLIRTLKNARENDDYLMGGLLILSYPSIEAYEVSGFLDESYKLQMGLGKDVKAYISANSKQIAMNKMNEVSIIHGAQELERYLCRENIQPDLDNMAGTSEKIYSEEERTHDERNTYFLLSMLSFILWDLGILQEQTEN